MAQTTERMDKTEIARATTLEEMDKRQSRLFAVENSTEAMKIELKSTDVVITPYPKCGTT